MERKQKRIYEKKETFIHITSIMPEIHGWENFFSMAKFVKHKKSKIIIITVIMSLEMNRGNFSNKLLLVPELWREG